MSLKIRINSQKIYAIIVSYMVSFMALLSLTNEIMNIINVRTVFDTMILYGIFYLLLILSILCILTRIRTVPIDVSASFILFGLFYFLTYFFFVDNRIYLFTSVWDYANNPMYYLFLYSLPGYIFIRQLKNYEYLKKVTTIFSYIIIVFSVIIFFYSPDSSAAQYLTFSYNMLFHMLFLIYNKPKKYKMIYNLVIILAVFVFTFGGSRGALLSFLLAILLMYIFRYRNDLRKIVLGYFAIIILFAMWGFRNELLAFLTEIIDYLSIDSRTLGFIIEGNILEDSIRMTIYQELLSKINLIGYGLMGDRMLLNGVYYAHNLFLEWLIDFGILGGTLLIIVFILILIKGLKNSNSIEQLYILMLLPNGVFELMFTGSYLNQTPALYVLVGFCVNSILRRKKE